MTFKDRTNASLCRRVIHIQCHRCSQASDKCSPVGTADDTLHPRRPSMIPSARRSSGGRRTERHASRSSAIGARARRRERHSSRRRSSLAKVWRREGRHGPRWRREARKTCRWRRERHAIEHRRSHSTAGRRREGHCRASSIACRDTSTWRREAVWWGCKWLTRHASRHWAACWRECICLRLNSLVLVVGHDRVNDALCTFATNFCAIVNVRTIGLMFAKVHVVRAHVVRAHIGRAHIGRAHVVRRVAPLIVVSILRWCTPVTVVRIVGCCMHLIAVYIVECCTPEIVAPMARRCTPLILLLLLLC